MSLKRRNIDPIPEETECIARAAFPKGTLYLTLRDELETLFTNAQFADIFVKEGHPAQFVWPLAPVSVKRQTRLKAVSSMNRESGWPGQSQRKGTFH